MSANTKQQTTHSFKCTFFKHSSFSIRLNFRTKEIIADDRARFARAWNSYFGNYGDRGGGTQEEAFEAWFEMIQNRFKYHVLKLEIENHPKYIKIDLKIFNQMNLDMTYLA